ncbi:hypothetical protein B0T17DRAFT_642089 [Bombardia bombarda]|uniref:Uncharacterized protein n=1 Tax=Bombardia bombarda TaxID=252184 RepID=A0AA39WUH2_9PEZI|nr:hypothetical protein B0T17DRAFT_642089 [Bombardia bombarda]
MDRVDYSVYIGFWTDWSYGKVLGATLTLERSDATLLIAFAAFYLTIVTTHIWAISCFCFHSCFSTRDPRDTVHHQRQAILRNNSGPVGTAWALIALTWAWRKTPGDNTARRVLPLLGYSILLAAGFGIAAGFSSRISRNSVVLLSPEKCRIIAGPSTAANITFLTKTWDPWLAKQIAFAASYAQKCYSTYFFSPVQASECQNSNFIQPQLLMSVDANASCPFDAALCVSNSSNLLLDTGLIDSHTHLGINSPPENRFQLRTVLHFAPLVTRGHTKSYTSPYNQSFTEYYYSTSPGQIVDESDTFLGGDPTYAYSDPSDFLSKQDYEESSWAEWNRQYKVDPPANQLGAHERAYYAQPYNGSYTDPNAAVDFVPIPGLRRPDVEFFVFFLSPNQVLFEAPTMDPWYNSSRTKELTYELPTWDSPVNTGKETKLKYWIAAEAASPLAGVSQTQICLPSRSGAQTCTPLGNFNHLSSNIEALNVDPSVVLRFWWAWDEMASADPSIINIAMILGSQALGSRYSLSMGLQGDILPDDQWKRDMLQRMAHEELGMGIWSRCDETIPVTSGNATLAVLDVSDEKHPLLQVSNEKTLVPHGPESTIVEEGDDITNEQATGIVGQAEDDSTEVITTVNAELPRPIRRRSI